MFPNIELKCVMLVAKSSSKHIIWAQTHRMKFILKTVLNRYSQRCYCRLLAEYLLNLDTFFMRLKNKKILGFQIH